MRAYRRLSHVLCVRLGVHGRGVGMLFSLMGRTAVSTFDVSAAVATAAGTAPIRVSQLDSLYVLPSLCDVVVARYK